MRFRKLSLYQLFMAFSMVAFRGGTSGVGAVEVAFCTIFICSALCVASKPGAPTSTSCALVGRHRWHPMVVSFLFRNNGCTRTIDAQHG
jgi:hypothetical protein